MDAEKYLKEIYRMCDEIEECRYCPLNGCNLTFPCKGSKESAEYKDAEKCVAEVEKWSAKHPAKTRQREFLKLHPNADIREGILNLCPRRIAVNSLSEDECRELRCSDCKKKYWLAEVE